jgi:phosphogluconate dehydratase
MSGASGKVPAAIHVTPEAADEGVLAKLRDGDPIRLDAQTGDLNVLLEPDILSAREPAVADLTGYQSGMGRELFGNFRAQVTTAEEGASAVSFLSTSGA